MTQTTRLTSALPSAWQKIAYSRGASLAGTAMAAGACTAGKGGRRVSKAGRLRWTQAGGSGAFRAAATAAGRCLQTAPPLRQISPTLLAQGKMQERGGSLAAQPPGTSHLRALPPPRAVLPTRLAWLICGNS